MQTCWSGNSCVRFGAEAIVLRLGVKRQFCVLVFGLWTMAFGVSTADAKPDVKISVVSPSEVRICIRSLLPSRSWSFRNAYAGMLGIAERVEQFQAFGAGGEDTGAQKIATGEFRAPVDVSTIEYVVKLALPGAADVAHVSWMAGESGFLMLQDLLPERLADATVSFSLPSGWSSEATIAPDTGGKYFVAEPEKAVFFVGRSLRKQSARVGGSAIDTVIDGAWPFADATVLKAVNKVFQKYLELTGFSLRGKSAVLVAPLPVAVGSVKWRAETRGSTVVLLMDPKAPVKNWAGQLGIIFTHELLHLWVPNALRFESDYDWFFEGFTLYTALVTALDLKFIDSGEYAATLRRVYDSYLSRPDELSLIDASERRWTSGNSTVYDKGMLVAFLYDLAIRKDSGGKRWLGNLYKELFARWATQPANGNEVIIQLLSSTPAGADIAKSYIEGQRELHLKLLLADQKELLKSLYYR